MFKFKIMKIKPKKIIYKKSIKQLTFKKLLINSKNYKMKKLFCNNQ